jgi:hypothetical protein
MTRLRQVSAERGISIAAVIREAVDRTLEQNERDRRWESALSVVGKYRDLEGATDVSRRIDDYVADAYEHWRR